MEHRTPFIKPGITYRSGIDAPEGMIVDPFVRTPEACAPTDVGRRLRLGAQSDDATAGVPLFEVVELSLDDFRLGD